MSVSKPVYVLNKRVHLKQVEGGFRTSMDAVFLAAVCPAKGGQTVLDMGCGVGSAGLCVLRRMDKTKLFGIDIQDDHITLARENAALNGMAARAEFETRDIRTLKGKSFDHALCNPPFLEAGTHMVSPSLKRAKAVGHTEKEISLKDRADAAYRNLKPGGSLTLIHRADHIDRILQALGGRFGATEIIPLWPKKGIAAKRIIIRARKDRKSPAILHPGLILHREDGKNTPAAEKILRGMRTLA